MSDPQPLANYLPRLTDLVTVAAAERGRRLPSFSQVVVSEEHNGQHLGSWLPASEFEDRFRQILDETNRDWVNLHGARVEEGQLCVVVEYLTTETGRPRTWTSDRISVNLSGPPFRWLDGLPSNDTE